jgi:hypothetical protein
LDPVAQDSIDWMIDLLNDRTDEAPDLGFPYSSAVKGADYRAFRELRAHGGATRYWIIYRRSERLFILLHIAPHKGDEIPESVKKIALDRWDDFKGRMDAALRKPPRAIGSDAP